MKAVAIVRPDNLEQAKEVVEAYRLVYPDIELVDLTKFHQVIDGCMFLSGLMNKVRENIIKADTAMLILDTEVRGLANPLSEYFEQIHLIRATERPRGTSWANYHESLQQPPGPLPTRSMTGYRYPRTYRDHVGSSDGENPQPAEAQPKGETVSSEPRKV